MSAVAAVAAQTTGYASTGSTGSAGGAGSAAAPVRIFYRLFGVPGATPVLIVHGLSFFSWDWIGPASRMAVDRQVAAMDMRGFGDSDWPGDYSLDANAADIIAVLDHLGWQKVVLIGHSMGGRHCALAAAQAPGRLAGLILIDFSPDIAPEGGARVAKRTASTPDTFASVDEAMRWAGIGPATPQGAPKRLRYEAYLKRVAGGFMILPPYFPGAFDDFVDQVVPELQRRGLYRRDYAGATLREHLAS